MICGGGQFEGNLILGNLTLDLPLLSRLSRETDRSKASEPIPAFCGLPEFRMPSLPIESVGSRPAAVFTIEIVEAIREGLQCAKPRWQINIRTDGYFGNIIAPKRPRRNPSNAVRDNYAVKIVVRKSGHANILNSVVNIKADKMVVRERVARDSSSVTGYSYFGKLVILKRPRPNDNILAKCYIFKFVARKRSGADIDSRKTLKNVVRKGKIGKLIIRERPTSYGPDIATKDNAG